MITEGDVLIVGGGPAGLAAAIAASQKGFRVVVADGAGPAINKVCGEGLMPEAALALAALGVKLREEECHAIRGVQFADAGAAFRADYGYANGLGVARTKLHERMIERAEECGVSLLWNTPITGIQEQGAISNANLLRAKWIVGADGARSRVRRWIGLETASSKPNRIGIRRHYSMRPWSDFIEISWGRASQAYVTPIAPNEVCVVLISKRAGLQFDEGLREYPWLAERLSGQAQSGRERGDATSMFQLKQVFRNNVALIGDASGSIDAIAGQGLALSFQQALALADALEQEDLKQYQAAHQQVFRRPRQLAQLLLLLSRWDGVRGAAFRLLQATPKVFELLHAYHMAVKRPIRTNLSEARLDARTPAA
ncbi:MAG TPA: FAD-dependent monooxygenase [Candidatus Acidoferrum sp.]|nr:FAD-dependent monooxygenase [Candidatus Acidoferrum sp.]